MRQKTNKQYLFYKILQDYTHTSVIRCIMSANVKVPDHLIQNTGDSVLIYYQNISCLFKD